MKFFKAVAIVAVALVMAFLMIAGLMALTGQTCPAFTHDIIMEYADV